MSKNYNCHKKKCNFDDMNFFLKHYLMLFEKNSDLFLHYLLKKVEYKHNTVYYIVYLPYCFSDTFLLRITFNDLNRH